jgi:homoserine dehydrogenase
MKSNQSNIVVLKFGSSVLRSEEELPHAVHEIYRHWRAGSQVLAVVSALGDTTNQLLARAQRICAEPDESAVAALLATGETTTSALLTLSLQKAGIPAKVLNATQAGLRTSGSVLDAELQSVDVERLRSELQDAVVVLPGFVGRGEQNGTTLLGRGGSDFTAVFVADQLDGRCVLLKDVPGVYTSDPARAATPPPRFTEVTYDTACCVGSTVVQPKAVRFAASRHLRFTASCIGASAGTEIGAPLDRIARPQTAPPPLEVALLGCGTVGGGVYERLSNLPECFRIMGVGVRDTGRQRHPDVPSRLRTKELEMLIATSRDVVVELIGGIEPAFELITRALRSGRHVVTANKALIAAQGETLRTLAAANGVTIRFSAAVGGALPALEAVQQAKARGPIRAISGVLNGTSNFILDQLAAGADFNEAVVAAQRAGYAEADPTLDLDGTDAAQKLILLARSAFGLPLTFHNIRRQGIQRLNADSLKASSDRGLRVRLVASCLRTNGGIVASVAPTELPHNHPLAAVKGAENCLLVELENGEIFTVSGTGAGRWPTTEAVLADLMELRREVCSQQESIQAEEACVA